MGSLLIRGKLVIVQCGLHLSTCLFLLVAVQAAAQAPAATPKTPPILGTIKTVFDNTMTVAVDTGTETKVTLRSSTRLLRVPPGSKDLSQAVTIPLSEFQAGDRVLVRLDCAGDPPACEASAVIAMKKSDIAEKQSHEREQWQRHGIGGLVKSVDAAQGSIIIGTMTAAGKKDVAIMVGKNTVLRRYAPGSVEFDDAKLSALQEVQLGDQLRARGARSADGTTFAADEIVTGTFRNIAGTVSAVDASTGTMTVNDLAEKKSELVKVSIDTQLRKLPANMAQMIAARLKGGATQAASQGTPAGNGAVPNSQGSQNGTAGGQGRGGDFQQLLNRLPATPLSDFQKGDAVMIVATGSQKNPQLTAITILGGVEPLLQSASREEASSILTPWSLSSGGADAAAAP
ncbi:MAG TPA: hypothetical protein VKB48_08215 [Candidatus Acidoferrum sp.]|nr:hypothetical protein [Candidatus Acidoferrum sp.]